MRFRFRHLAATTTALTFVLILLGVYTGAMGAGLACEARWPFCDGWLGLFPATWPSFLEWFHRLVAMITGFFILGTAYAAWRRDADPRIRKATVFALAVLPVQILLGGNTVLNFGAVASTVHHAAALLIFGSLVATTAWSYVAVPRGSGAEADDVADSSGSGPVRL